MSALRLSIKFYRHDLPADGEPYWRWFDAIVPPRVGDFVAQPRSDVVCKVLAVTWVEPNEVNVTIEGRP